MLRKRAKGNLYGHTVRYENKVQIIWDKLKEMFKM